MFKKNLHSTMVRFIILIFHNSACVKRKFTFHYGQIYYELLNGNAEALLKAFTFHYGQIYYTLEKYRTFGEGRIYIPLWLDLLFVSGIAPIPSLFAFTFHYGQIYYERCQDSKFQRKVIYIPLWLDLLQLKQFKKIIRFLDLHSTMVRFIIRF